jgi:DNA polymerase-3 subunit delta
VDREVLVAEPGFKWDAFFSASRNLSLFGSRRLVDLRIPSGRPGVEGARALEAYAADPNPDAVTLITLPRLDRAAQTSGWFVALERSAVVVAVQPVERGDLPQWIAERLARGGQRASSDTLRFLADTTEGNLLAAQQEIDKLALQLPEGELDPEAVERAVADVARFDVFQLSEAWLVGDAGRALRILGVLESVGEAVPLVLWQLGEDLHALAGVLEATSSGVPISAALRSVRVWGKRQAALERAARRVEPEALSGLLGQLATLDALAKGIGRGNAWDELRSLALRLCKESVAA